MDRVVRRVRIVADMAAVGSRNWALDCAAGFAAELGDRWSHARGVAGVAERLTASLPDEAEVLVAAALLHDIGYAASLRRTGMHAVDGAQHLVEIGAPAQVVSLVAFHTGAEYEADERGLADELTRFDRPRQDLLDALILADLSTGPDGEPMSVARRVDDIFRRYPPEHAVHRAVRRSREYLLECVGRAQFVSLQPR